MPALSRRASVLCARSHSESCAPVAGPWTFGPWSGVYLQQHVSFAAPFAVAAVAAVVLLVLFWWLRLTELAPPSRKPPNPLRYLPRFFAQPRLRLAWGLAGARSAWWSTFYVFTPIFAVTSGLTPEAGGAIASFGTGWIFVVPLWGWVGRVTDCGACWPSAMQPRG